VARFTHLAALALGTPAANADTTPATPASRVFVAYKHHAFLQFCHQARGGYLVQWIDDDEIDRADAVVKAVVAKAREQAPAIDTDEIWKAARQTIRGMFANLDMCQMEKNQLFGMAFDAVL
jgi:hypothetical protein